MKLSLLSFTLASLTALFLPATADANDELRRDLERVYARWRTAMVSKDLSLWKNTTAAYRQAELRNTVVSKKLPFPQIIFQVPVRPPETAHLRHLRTTRENDTAVAIYYGRVDFGVDVHPIPENLLVLNFVREDGAWKFDSTRFVNLGPSDDVRRRISGGDIALLESADFKPLGAVPPTPPLCPDPDYAAHIHIVSVGYRTKADINSLHQSDVSQTGMTDIVIGGLKEGENTLNLQIEPLDEPTDASLRQFSVSVYVLRRDEKKPPVRVFHYAPETVPASHEAPVWANAVTLNRR